MGKSVKVKKKKNNAAKSGVKKPVTVRVFEAGVDTAETKKTKVAKTVEVAVAKPTESMADEISEPAPKALPAGNVKKTASAKTEKLDSAQSDVEITKVKKSGPKSMSGMVVEVTKNAGLNEMKPAVQDLDEKKDDSEKNGDTKKSGSTTDGEELAGEPRFTQAKSALIGVGVAVAVAVIGFIGIGIFTGGDTRKCTVQFDSNGGSEVASTQIVCGKAVTEPSEPTKEGFSFQGWALEGDPFDFGSMTVYNNAILIARWVANEGTETVTVKFNSNGGSDIDEIELARGATLSEPTRKPTRSGYTFGGWYLGNERYQFGKAVSADLTLTAHWVKVATPPSNSNNNLQPNQPTGGNNQQPSEEKPEEPAEVKVESLSVGDVEREAGSGGFDVTVGVAPAEAVYELTVSSSNSGIANCSVKGGNVLGCTVGDAAGEAVISVKDQKSGKSTNFKVAVKEKMVLLTGVVISGLKTVEVDKTIQLTATLADEGAVAEVSWSSSNGEVATVSGGVVTGVAAGSVTITVTAKQGEKMVEATYEITVTAASTGGEESGGVTKPEGEV